MVRGSGNDPGMGSFRSPEKAEHSVPREGNCAVFPQGNRIWESDRELKGTGFTDYGNAGIWVGWGFIPDKKATGSIWPLGPEVCPSQMSSKEGNIASNLNCEKCLRG